MLVQMKTTDYFSPDGITSYLYQNGVRYDVPDRLGEQLIEQGQAERVDLDREERERAQPLGQAGTASPGQAAGGTEKKAPRK